jgi:hypothetical protein
MLDELAVHTCTTASRTWNFSVTLRQLDGWVITMAEIKQAYLNSPSPTWEAPILDELAVHTRKTASRTWNFSVTLRQLDGWVMVAKNLGPLTLSLIL